MSKKLVISLSVVTIFHLVGIIGMLSDHPSFFIKNTPLNLYLTAFFLLINHEQWSMKQVFCLLIIICFGFLAEIIGTSTGYLFGDYRYGNALGVKLYNVPLVIGVNWMMQIYIAGNITERLKINSYLKAASGAFMLVILDYFMEPVAIKLDYWQWENNVIPLTNYISWFFISYLFLSLLSKFGVNKYNSLAGYILILQFFMFIILNRFLN